MYKDAILVFSVVVFLILLTILLVMLLLRIGLRKHPSKKEQSKEHLESSTVPLYSKEQQRMQKRLTLLLDRLSDVHLPFGVFRRLPSEYFRRSDVRFDLRSHLDDGKESPRS